MNKRTLAVTLLTSSLSLGVFLNAYGQEEKTVTSVPITLSWDKQPRPGEGVGKIYAKTSSAQFIVDGAVYDKEEDVWFSGEQPIVEVDLSAREGYRFSGTDKNSFLLSGCSAWYKEAIMEEDGSSLTLWLSLPQIKGTLPAPTAAGWNGNQAVWDAVEGAIGYEIKIYNGNNPTGTTISDDASCDLSPYINREGVYTFNVKALGTYTTQASVWSESSGSHTVSREDAWYISNGTWKDTSHGWRYEYGNGVYPADEWRCIGEQWYYFNQQGYMISSCYVKAPDEEVYRWLGDDGAWVPQYDTPNPDIENYEIIR